MTLKKILKDLNVSLKGHEGEGTRVFSPINGKELAEISTDTEESYEEKSDRAVKAFEKWRDVPAPRRGELVRLFGEELRANKDALGKLVTMECGKIYQEGLGEVQEMIDICDFAVGLSRTVGGHTIPSERPQHSMQENWYPLGVVGVISAFNFPVAVWAWNTALALVCGDPVIWKPSEKTPITAIACQQIFERAVEKFGEDAPEGLSQIIIGDSGIGKLLVDDPAVSLISATGSCRMGRIVGPKVQERFGRCLLELGGNNAVIVTESADMDIVLPSILFGSVGTCGQRCTSTRRAFVHESIYDEFCKKLITAYKSVTKKIGDPLSEKTIIGPLIDEDAFSNMQTAINQAVRTGGEVYGGERVLESKYKDAYYVEPALVKIDEQVDVVRNETFAPILYVMPYKELSEAIKLQNDVPQGLSSAIFTTDIREAETFKKYSDCGIANVNIGTSGAEIGGAFGGEKETGGGRESGSDAWKIYMRRQTSTTYYGEEPPALAQGIKFGD